MSKESPNNGLTNRLDDRMADRPPDRLAEAARYAVLNRLLPVLRHDVAGAMQAPRMLLMVLEKRLQAAEPDLLDAAENLKSVSTLTKQATVGCMAALGWIASSDNPCVNLRGSTEEIIALLAMEMSVNGLALTNSIEDDTATAPQAFVRNVFTGALLAFCDQYAGGGTLQVTFKPASAASPMSGQLHLQLATDGIGPPPASAELFRKSRLIEWPDVQAMAQSMGAAMEQGDGWLSVDVPRY